MRPKMLQIMFRVADKERVIQLASDLGLEFPHITEEDAGRLLTEGQKRGLDIRFTAVDLPEMPGGGGGFPETPVGGGSNSIQEMLGGLMNQLMGGGGNPGEMPPCPDDCPTEDCHSHAKRRNLKPRGANNRGKSRSKVSLKGRPKRDQKINNDDLANLAIAINTAKSFDEFIEML